MAKKKIVKSKVKKEKIDRQSKTDKHILNSKGTNSVL